MNKFRSIGCAIFVGLMFATAQAQAQAQASAETGVGGLDYAQSEEGIFDIDIGGATVAFSFEFDNEGTSILAGTFRLDQGVGETFVSVFQSGFMQTLFDAFGALVKEPSEVRLELSIGSISELAGIIDGDIPMPAIRMIIPFGLRLDPTQAHLRLVAGLGITLPSPADPPKSFKDMMGNLTVLGGLEEGEQWTNMFGLIPGGVKTFQLKMGFAGGKPESINLDAVWDLPELGEGFWKMYADPGDPLNNYIDFHLEDEAVNLLFTGINPMQPFQDNITQIANTVLTIPGAKAALGGDVVSVLKNVDQGVTVEAVGFHMSAHDLTAGITPNLEMQVKVKIQTLIDQTFNLYLPSLDAAQLVGPVAKDIGDQFAGEASNQIEASIYDIVDVSGLVAEVFVDAGNAVAGVANELGGGGEEFFNNFGDEAKKLTNQVGSAFGFGGGKNKKSFKHDYKKWEKTVRAISETALIEYSKLIEVAYSRIEPIVAPMESPERDNLLTENWDALTDDIMQKMDNLYVEDEGTLKKKHMKHTGHKRPEKVQAMRDIQYEVYGDAKEELQRLLDQKYAQMMAG